MVFISCFANFELKQSDSVGRMTAQPHNRFVFFLCRGRRVRCKWKLDFVSFLYKDKWWFHESMSVIFCMENI